MTRQVVIYRVLLPFVLPRHALARPVAFTSTTPSIGTYLPLIVISLSILFLAIVFLSVKVLYMKYRRIGTIHSPPVAPSLPTTSDLSSTSRSFASSTPTGSEWRIERGPWYRGLLVGCFGSPTWETNITAKQNGRAWPTEQQRKASFAYRLHRNSKRRSARSFFAPLLTKSKNSTSTSRFTRSSMSFFSFSSDADEHVSASSVPSSSNTSRLPQHTHSPHGHSQNGADGNLGVLAPEGHAPKIGRRVSPSSIRLIDGPGYGDPVAYSFLSGTPPKSTATSPLIGTRDSLQLSRCSLKCDRGPVPPLPPLPPLPSLSPLSPLEQSEAPVFLPVPASEYLSLFHLSPPEKKTSDIQIPDTNKGARIVSKVPYVKRKLSRASDVTGTEPQTRAFVQDTPAPHPLRDTNRKPKHKRSLSHRGLAIEVLVDENAGPLPLSPVDENQAVRTMRTDNLRTPSNSSRSSTTSKKPLKPCLRQSSITSVPSFCSPDNVLGTQFAFTPSISETSTRAYSQSTEQSADDQASLRTPICDIDIGMLGLDRFRWNDEIKELKVRPSHMKKDSFALVSELLWEQDGWAREQK